MKSKTMIWLFAFSFGLNVIFLLSLVYDGFRKPAPPHRPPPGKGGPPLAFALQFDEERLHLTPVQKQGFKAIRERWEQAEWAERNQSMDRINRLGGVLIQDEISTQTLQPLLREVRRHSDDFFVRLMKAIKEHRALLTPEQNKIFTQLAQERFQRFQDQMRRHNMARQKWLDQQNVSPSAKDAQAAQVKTH